MAAEIKVLFVHSSRKQKGISPFIKEQAFSLVEQGINLDYFSIVGSGLFNYISSIFKLNKYLKRNKFDIIHAHYNLSGIVSLLANIKYKAKIVVSLMGDDLYGSYNNKNQLTLIGRINILLSKFFLGCYDAIIVKSEKMARLISQRYKSKINVIPNGVNCDKFIPADKNNSREKINLEINNKYILFLNNFTDMRKNYAQFEAATKNINNKFNILTPYPVEHEKVVDYLNACDVLVQVSKLEGSSNLIKEAMACNCPIVSTIVGDVEWVFGKTEGCYLTTFKIKDTSQKIKEALEFAEKKGRTEGRERIFELGLDSETIAKKIIKVYENVLNS